MISGSTGRGNGVVDIYTEMKQLGEMLEGRERLIVQNAEMLRIMKSTECFLDSLREEALIAGLHYRAGKIEVFLQDIRAAIAKAKENI